MDWATLLQAIVFSRFLPAPQRLFLRPTSRAILAASQPIILTASLVPGVAAADAAKSDTLLAGVAGLVAGAMSMNLGKRPKSRSSRVTLALSCSGVLPPDANSRQESRWGCTFSAACRHSLGDWISLLRDWSRLVHARGLPPEPSAIRSGRFAGCSSTTKARQTTNVYP